MQSFILLYQMVKKLTFLYYVKSPILVSKTYFEYFDFYENLTHPNVSKLSHPKVFYSRFFMPKNPYFDSKMNQKCGL